MERKPEGKTLRLRSMQALDLMDRNRVERHGAPGKLARDSEAQEGSKRLDVNAAGVRRKSSHLIRGDLPRWAGGSRGHSSRRRGKRNHKAKGQTAKELSDHKENSDKQPISGESRSGCGREAEGRG
jgi:hypothetical protein